MKKTLILAVACGLMATAAFAQTRTPPNAQSGSGEGRRAAVPLRAGFRQQGCDQRYVRDSIEPTFPLEGALGREFPTTYPHIVPTAGDAGAVNLVYWMILRTFGIERFK
jgi:hypothetical protein